MNDCTIFAAGEITSDTTTTTECESPIDSDIEAFKQARGIEKVAETCEFFSDGFFEGVATRVWWVRVSEVVRARNQVLGTTVVSGLSLCQTHSEHQSHHQ